VIVVDGMQGGTAPRRRCFIEHVGIPTLAAVRQAVDALEDLNMKDQVQLIVSGGIRTGADVAKALAMGADAVSIGQGTLMALGCNRERWFADGEQPVDARADYAALGTARRRLPPLPHRPLPRRHHHAGRGARAAAAAGLGRPPPAQLPEDA
jgi:tRNA-dihydrouridine synthase